MKKVVEEKTYTVETYVFTKDEKIVEEKTYTVETYVFTKDELQNLINYFFSRVYVTANHFYEVGVEDTIDTSVLFEYKKDILMSSVAADLRIYGIDTEKTQTSWGLLKD